MGDPLDAERAVLENWKRERDELDAAIAVLEKKIAARGSSVSPAISSGRIVSDEFFRMSTPDAVKKFLKIIGRPARSTTDIIDGLKTGGMATNYTNVYTSLMRLQKKDEVVKVGEDWGLSEWYPPGPVREAKPALADLSTEELIEKAEDFLADKDKQEPAGIASGDQPHASGKGRKEEIAEFIRLHGPSTRSEVLAGTTVPDGTISYCLKDATKFVQDKDGKWRNVE
jgi:hypothetical protein